MMFVATYPSPLGTIVMESDGEALTALRFGEDSSCSSFENSANGTKANTTFVNSANGIKAHTAK